MFCSKCGTTIKNTDKFCSGCGNEIIIITNNEKSKKNKKFPKIIISILLCMSIILGIVWVPTISNFIVAKKISDLVGILSNGHWMATSTKNTIALDSFGFIFSDELSAHNSIFAISTDGQIMMCTFESIDNHIEVRMSLEPESSWKEGRCH